MLSSDNILQSLVKVKSIEICIVLRNLDCDMYHIVAQAYHRSPTLNNFFIYIIIHSGWSLG